MQWVLKLKSVNRTEEILPLLLPGHGDWGLNPDKIPPEWSVV